MTDIERLHKVAEKWGVGILEPLDNLELSDEIRLTLSPLEIAHEVLGKLPDADIDVYWNIGDNFGYRLATDEYYSNGTFLECVIELAERLSPRSEKT